MMEAWGNWLLLHDGLALYVLLFFLLVGGAIGFPIPEDVPLILAGVVVHHGRADLLAALGVSYSAVLIGDFIIFSVGRRFGPRLFNAPWFNRHIPADRARRINRGLDRHRLWMIFIARHLFYLRTATFLTCGAFGMSLPRFLVADALAALISTPLMVGMGYLLAENFDFLADVVSKAKVFSLVIGVLVVVSVFLVWKRKRSEELGELPKNLLEESDSKD